MKLNEPLIAEIRHESATTRLMLERVPEGSLNWRPHQKSRTLGEIAAHVANLPGVFIAPLDRDEFDRNKYTYFIENTADILETFDRNIANALSVLEVLSDEKMISTWKYKYGDKVIFEMPRLAVIRAMALNHLIHHRGQLSVYLRMLDVSVPGAYGPSADDAAAQSTG